MKRTVAEIAGELGVWEAFVLGVNGRLDSVAARGLVNRLALLPVRASHAVGLLGSYVHRGAEPIAIRLQLAQERPLLGVTLLHELAHACEHLTAVRPQHHRCSHGSHWRGWAEAFGIAPERVSRSTVLGDLRAARLKPVAVCERCGCVFHRLRRLPKRRQWLHPQCGNGRVVALPVSGGGR